MEQLFVFNILSFYKYKIATSGVRYTTVIMAEYTY